MESKTILIADDESRIRKLVKDYLNQKGYLVLEAENGQQAVQLLKKTPSISLIILDIMMPVMDGYEACREIRRFSQVPVLMLTAKGEESDELEGFDCGADDYIAKPFSPRILTARVDAILRRKEEAPQGTLEAGGIRVDVAAHQVFSGEQLLELSGKEFELLEYFLRNRGIALTRESILSQVWNFEFFGDSRTIDTHVKKLRAKLGEKGDYIKTIWGLGYKFEVNE